MKRIFPPGTFNCLFFSCAIGLFLLPPCRAQSEHYIRERGPHHQVVESVVSWVDELGNTLTETNSYVQLETGLNYWNESGQWEESRAEFELIPGAAIAWKGQHKVSLAANLNMAGAVQMRLPDGGLMSSHVYGLAYFDMKSGQSVLVAEVKDSQGLLVSPNELVYPDAFNGVRADVRYTYTRAGFEQDIILRETPPDPTAYGLNPETTRLEVWTEFEQAPEPVRRQRRGEGRAVEHSVDEELDFGLAKIGSGRTFRLGRENESLTLVVKHWMVDPGGRRFLVESVDLSAVAGGLDELPGSKGGASLGRPQKNRFEVVNKRPAKVRRPDVEKLQVRRLDRGRESDVVANLSRPGLVLDYLTLNTSQTNYTFASDETYYISGAVVLTGKTTFEGGTVLKIDSSTTAKLEVQGALDLGGTAYRPVVFTAKDDNTVGQLITGSTGVPTNSYYGSAGGTLVLNNGTNVTLTHVRLTHQRRALEFSGGTEHTVRHGQVVRCQEGVDPVSTVHLHNVLFHNVNRVLAGSTATVDGQHLTVNQATQFNYNSAAAVTLRNSLLVQVATPGSYTNQNSSVETASAGTGLFQVVSGGSHYLVSGSSYRNSGTTNIDSKLATELKVMTTEAPLVLTGAVNLDTTLSPRVQRDTDQPDKGYHYVPLDYVLKAVNLTVPLRLTNGVAVAVAGTYGVDLQDGSQFIGEGRADNMNRLTRWHNVQEQWTGEGNGGPMTKITASYGTRPVVSVRFTELTALSKSGTTLLDTGNTQPFASVTVEFCQSCNVGIPNLWPIDSSSSAVVLRNNLFERATVSVNHSYYSYNTPLTFSAYNNLFWRGALQVAYDSGTSNPTWVIKDNLFDGTSQTLSGNSTASVTRSNNGFTSGTTNTYVGSGDKTGLSIDYQTNAVWGVRYYPASGGAPSLATLIDAGSRTRETAGLYHFTVKSANSTKEGADTPSTVDLGFHYIGLNTFGVPNDADGDGIPDYVEDRNGNNYLDTGESDPAVSNGVGVGTAALVVFTPLQ
ncbi:MAG: hypothetical protein ACKO3H_15600 [Verrucomicrobiota bacterium]